MAAATSVAYVPTVPGLVVIKGTCTLDPTSISAGASQDQTIAVGEAKVGDMVLVQPRAALTDGCIAHDPHVSAAGTITFTIDNHSAGAIDLASATWDWMILRGVQGFPYAG